MSVERLQQAIRRCKTPVALGLRADETVLKPALVRQFTEMYGEGRFAVIEALRYHGCRVLQETAGTLPAVYLDAMSYLRYGSAGLDVLQNLCAAAHSHGFYVIADCRTERAEGWFDILPEADGVTVSPYSGGESCRVPEGKTVFPLLRTAGALSGEVQSLMAGDRRLYMAVADQMARRGLGCVMETGYSLDIREVRKKQEKLFLVLTHCDCDSAAWAFDDYGHGALVVDDAIQFAADGAEAAASAVKAMKKVAAVL